MKTQEAQMKDTDSLIRRLANIAPKAALLAIVVLVLLAASPKSFACFNWGTQFPILVPEGQFTAVNVYGSLTGIAAGNYVMATSQSGSFTLQNPQFFYNNYKVNDGINFLPTSPIGMYYSDYVPNWVTAGQTANLTYTLKNMLGQLVCSTTITVKVVQVPKSPALSTEMNTIGSNNEADEYYKGTNFHLYQLSWPGTWKYADVTTLAGAPLVDALSPIVSQVDAFHNRSEVFYLDSYQHVEEAYYDNIKKTWNHADITSIANFPAAKAGSPLTSLVGPYDNSIQVEYVDSAGHIRQLYSYDGTAWYGYDLTLGTGAPLAAAGTTLVSQVDTSTYDLDVYYIDSNQNIERIWLHYGWHVSNLTVAVGAGAPKPATGSSLVSLVNPYDNSMQLEFVDSSGHIHQVYSYNRTNWYDYDLTQGTGAPPAAAGTALASMVNTITPQVEVYYIDSSQNVEQIWLNNGWHVSNITLAAGAPQPAAQSPVVSLVNTRANTIQAHYIGSDSHVHELWWNGAWHTDDVTNAAGSYPAVP